ncbi:hypothetical protein CYFUS_009029 [Cystobacter fuscus]|uniref:Uncharacterized protein n=1 Tax=Cystobacter fuscus TaxID=43 RepID=A0A250JI25_9BACT|nr:hypothetical protein CYFUS_009029 [Cystobacter fuscus]
MKIMQKNRQQEVRRKEAGDLQDSERFRKNLDDFRLDFRHLRRASEGAREP